MTRQLRCTTLRLALSGAVTRMESWAKKLLSDRVLVPSTLTTNTLVAEYTGRSRLVWGLMLVGLFMAGLSGFLCFAIVVRLWSERLVWTSPLTLFGLPAFAALFLVSTYHSASLLLEPSRWARLRVDEQGVTL